MFPAARLLSSHHITLFTRPNCSLCHQAEKILSKVWDQRRFGFSKIDVMTPGQEKWKSAYEFDTPVIHVDRVAQHGNTAETTLQSPKLMHRFTATEVEALME